MPEAAVVANRESSEQKSSESETSSEAERRERETFRLDCIRAAGAGVIDTAASTFVLLVAVKAFGAPAAFKSLVASATSGGLILAPLVVWFAAKHRIASSKIVAGFLTAAALGFGLAAAVPSLWMYTLGSAFALLCVITPAPFVTQIYQDNYRPGTRGRLYSRSSLVRILVALGFGWLGGEVLDAHVDRYPLLFVFFGLCLAGSALAMRRVRAQPLAHNPERVWWAGFRFIRTDTLFRTTLVCWMLMGFAALMMAPLRVEYLGNPEHGYSLTAGEIAWYLVVLPSFARLVVTPLWGGLFDRMSFFWLRISVNLFTLAGIFALFLMPLQPGLLLSAVAYGIAAAGGEIAWSLWVTKFAPAQHVADYMAVHTFLTGLRGIAAPIVAFWAIGHISIPTLAVVSVTMILMACIVLVPEALADRRKSKLERMSKIEATY